MEEAVYIVFCGANSAGQAAYGISPVYAGSCFHMLVSAGRSLETSMSKYLIDQKIEATPNITVEDR